MTEVVRVMVVDDHAVVRAGLQALLSGDEGVEFVGEARTAEEAVQRAGAYRPDVVLMDLQLATVSTAWRPPAGCWPWTIRRTSSC